MTGSLHEKNGKWQLVLYGAVEILFPDKKSENPSKKVCKWISSNLSATSKNRLLASKMLVEKIMEYEQQENLAAERKALIDKGIILPTLSVTTDILFTDFVEDWLNRKQGQIQQSTWEKYQIYAERHIIPYFAELNVKLSELKPRHFVDYYQYKSTGGRLDGKEGGLDITSVRGHAALIRTILNEAVIFEYINGNPAQNVAVPKRARTNAKSAKNVYMTATEANDMLKAIENDDIFPLVYVAITYGLRKSEVLGLKWDAVDFEQNTLEIKSTVVKNKTIVYKDTTKTESSHETYELLPEIKELLIAIKAEQNGTVKSMKNSTRRRTTYSHSLMAGCIVPTA